MGQRRPAVAARMPGRWNSNRCPDIHYRHKPRYRPLLGSRSCARDRGAGWIEVVREADDLSGICVPKWTLQGRLLSFAKPTIIGWLLIAKPADVVPPGSSPKSVMIICDAPAAYLIDGACPAFIIALSARLMTPATSLIVFIVV